MSVFVTVGTTQFNDLIETVSTNEVLSLLEKNHFHKVVIQKGNGPFVPDEQLFSKYNIQLEVFDYKPSIKTYIQEADLVIGHAGAGTIIETLRSNKKMVVVINEHLMNNHQREISNALSKDGYLLEATCSTLVSVLETLSSFQTKAFPQSNARQLASVIDEQMIL